MSQLRTEIGTQLKASPLIEGNSKTIAGSESQPDSERDIRREVEGTSELLQQGIVLPELEQYFVRCIEGMEGVLYLRKEVQKDPNRFWVIGCNRWAWEYLGIVSKMDAYFDRTVTLPALTAPELRTWLAPARRHLRELLPQVSLPSPSAYASFFDSLARASGGLSSVAPQLWLSSLSMVNPAEPSVSKTALAGVTLAGASFTGAAPVQNQSLVVEENGGDQLQLELARPVATKLPILGAGDRYLLYSLLLHNGLQFWHLALSLGENESLVLARLKGLQRQGIVKQQGRTWYVRSEYYPNLRSTLAGNNFLVAKDG